VIRLLSTAGFKSISDVTNIELSKLTILAGANSSGKSSALQPMLLLKQTLEASYDPGDLLLNGPNVQFTSVRQLLSKTDDDPKMLMIGIATPSLAVIDAFTAGDRGLRLFRTTYQWNDEEGSRKAALEPNMTRRKLLRNLPPDAERFREVIAKQSEWDVVRQRCFYGVAPSFISSADLSLGPAHMIDVIRRVIHVPGLRGNPERTYGTTAVGAQFPGTFERYVASIVAAWQSDRDERLRMIGSDLRKLDLTWKVAARQLDDTQVELRVGRLRRGSRGGAQDMVNIADVGFGVSQTLPVLVALRAADSSNLVYVEQPEIHLHPRAQIALGSVLADAVGRGVQVVVETHSALLLLSIQTLVAEGQLSADDVKLHWFTRNDLGDTKVKTARLEDDGSFGDWPEDFADVILTAESRYVGAAAKRLASRRE
jgi:hypothetical protein